MPDYQGNSKKQKEAAKVPDKNIEPVIINKVSIQKPSNGRKFKDLFIKTDPGTVAKGVVTEVLLPALINMFVDSSKSVIELLFYGEAAIRRRNLGAGPRFMYNNPINRERGGYPGTTRNAPPISPEPRALAKHTQDTIILTTREEADLVLERMTDIIDTHDAVSMADLYQLVGLPTTHIDNKWGWVFLGDAHIRQIREGYLIDLPPAEPLQ